MSIFNKDVFINNMASYDNYYQKCDKVFHFITIILLLFTFMFLTSFIRVIDPNDTNGIGLVIGINAGSIFVLLSLIYLFIEVGTALFIFVTLLIMYFISNMIYIYLPMNHIVAGIIATALHVCTWSLYIDYVSNHISEEKYHLCSGDTLIMDIFIIPMFVFLRILFCCGYNRDLFKKINMQKLFIP